MQKIFIIIMLFLTRLAFSNPMITNISYSGSACPEGSLANNISPDGDAFTVMYANFLVDSSLSQGVPTKKSCAIEVELSPSSRGSFAVFQVDMRGYAALQKGVIGVARMTSHLTGRGPKQGGRLKLVGPYDDSYFTQTNIPLAEQEWSPCRKKARFTLKTVLVVRPERGYRDSDLESVSTEGLPEGGGFPVGYMTVDSVDGAVIQTYRLKYRPCERR